MVTEAVNLWLILCESSQHWRRESTPGGKYGSAKDPSIPSRLRRFRMRDGFRSIDASAGDAFSYDSSIGIVRALGRTQLAIEIEHVRERGDRPGLNDPLRRHETIPVFQRHREAQPRAPRGKPKRVSVAPGQGLPSTSASPRHARAARKS